LRSHRESSFQRQESRHRQVTITTRATIAIRPAITPPERRPPVSKANHLQPSQKTREPLRSVPSFSLKLLGTANKFPAVMMSASVVCDAETCLPVHFTILNIRESPFQCKPITFLWGNMPPRIGILPSLHAHLDRGRVVRSCFFANRA